MGLDNPLHIAFLVVILLLVFGARRLPEIGRSLGSGMREFKDSISGEQRRPAGARPAAAGADSGRQQPQAPAQAPPVAAASPRLRPPRPSLSPNRGGGPVRSGPPRTPTPGRA